MIKKDVKEIFNKTVKPLTKIQKRGGGNYSKLVSFINKRVFTVSTTSLWSLIAMNKQYMTGLTCQYGLLISPFDNLTFGCNGVMKAVKSRQVPAEV